MQGGEPPSIGRAPRQLNRNADCNAMCGHSSGEWLTGASDYGPISRSLVCSLAERAQEGSGGELKVKTVQKNPVALNS